MYCNLLSYTENGEVRLVNGSLPSEGRIEMWYNSTWRTVCQSHDYHYYFNSFEIGGVYLSIPSEIFALNMICKQLGFAGVLKKLHNAPYGPREFPLLPVYWRTEYNMIQCEPISYSSSNCEVATVACEDINGKFIITSIGIFDMQ